MSVVSREQLIDLAAQRLEALITGSYRPSIPVEQVDRAVRRLMLGIDRDILSATLLMTSFVPGEFTDATMRIGIVSDEHGLPALRLEYSRPVFGMLLELYQQHGFGWEDYPSVCRVLELDQTFPLAVEHELWHVLLGDLSESRLARAASDPIYHLAIEIRINDGYLGPSRIRQRLVQPLTLDSLGVRDAAHDAASRLGYSGSWLMDEEKVYQVLRTLFPDSSSSGYQELLRQLDVQLPDDRLDTVTPGPTNDLQLSTIQRRLFQLVEHDPRVQYDPHRLRLNWDPRGFSEPRRVVRPRQLRANWSPLLRVLGLDVSRLGWNRRLGASLPADQVPLIRRVRDTCPIEVFIDSSGSVPDDLVAGFLQLVRRSPLRVRIHYFHTAVESRPMSGNTRFACIEEYLRNLPVYPRVVLVLTDGHDHGERFTPLHPSRWYWIVTDDPSTCRQIGGTVIQLVSQEVYW